MSNKLNELKAEGNKAWYDEAKDIVKEMREAGVTIGYIGSLWTNVPPEDRDDRSWMIFLPHSGRVGTRDDRIGGYPTESRGRLLHDARALLKGYRLGLGQGRITPGGRANESYAREGSL